MRLVVDFHCKKKICISLASNWIIISNLSISLVISTRAVSLALPAYARTQTIWITFQWISIQSDVMSMWLLNCMSDKIQIIWIYSKLCKFHIGLSTAIFHMWTVTVLHLNNSQRSICFGFIFSRFEIKPNHTNKKHSNYTETWSFTFSWDDKHHEAWFLLMIKQTKWNSRIYRNEFAKNKLAK